METDYFDPTYDERKKEVFNVILNPLIQIQYRISDTIHISSEGEIYDYVRKFNVNITWLADIMDVADFVRLDKKYIMETQDFSEEEAQNFLLDSDVSALVRGHTGSNVLDYDKIVNQPIPDVKTHIENLDEMIDWSQMYNSELQGENRKTLKEWINKKRIEESGERYERIKLATLKSRSVYPEKIESLGFGVRKIPSISWQEWADMGPQYIDGESPPEEISSMCVNDSCQQRLELEDGTLTPAHSYDLGHSVDLRDFEWFFRRTIPEENLSWVTEHHDYDSKSSVEDAAVGKVKSIVEDALKKYNIDEYENATKIKSSNERTEIEL